MRPQRSMARRPAQYAISLHSGPRQYGSMLDDPRIPALLAPALLVFCGGVLHRLTPLPGLAAAFLPLGLVLGFLLLIGAVQASPRQLGERLPMLGLLLLVPAFLACRWPRPWLRWPLLAGAALLTGWWMGGGALNGPDLTRALPVMLGLTVAAGLGGAALRGPWQGALLSCGLALLLMAASPPGPWADLALVPAVIGLAALIWGAALPMPGWLVLGPAVAALAAGPVLALGRGPDWAVAATLLAAAAIGLVGRLGLWWLAAQALLLLGGVAILWLT